MQIKKVYTTSKGMFWSMKEAEHTKNRVQRYTNANEPIKYEPVLESYVMMAKVGDSLEVFQMLPAVVK